MQLKTVAARNKRRKITLPGQLVPVAGQCSVEPKAKTTTAIGGFVYFAEHMPHSQYQQSMNKYMHRGHRLRLLL